jgi:hypothetical protein
MPQTQAFPEWDEVLIREVRRHLPRTAAEAIVDAVEGLREDDKRQPGNGTARAQWALEGLGRLLEDRP